MIYYKVVAIRKPGRLERTYTNLMHFKWEVTWTHGTQLNTFYVGQACE